MRRRRRDSNRACGVQQGSGKHLDLLFVDRPVRSIRSTIERVGCAPLNAG
jgi:hypothetical protein